MIYLVELLLGIGFGFVLQKCGLGEYHRVVNQFRLKDWTVMQFMLTAVATGSALVVAGVQLGWIDLEITMPEGALAAALLGGAVLGVGMALSGMCPGTIVAGIGRGSLDYLVPGVLGLVAGAFVMGIAFDHLPFAIFEVANTGTQTIAELANINPWAVVAAFLACDGALFLATSPRLRKTRGHSKSAPDDAPRMKAD